MTSVKQSSKKNSGKPSGSNSRTRNFATVVYPESAPGNWQAVLSDYHVAALISPLHDMDCNPDGEKKKPHYHVLLMFDGVKDFDKQVKPMFDAIGGVGREIVNSARGYARYLCHLDNPEKHQYSVSDVVCFGGADYDSITHLPTDDMHQLKDIFAFIKANNILSFVELLDICAECRPDWFSTIAMSRAYVVEKYIKSFTFELQMGYVRSSFDAEGKLIVPEGNRFVNE